MVKTWAVVFAPWQGKGCQLSSWFNKVLKSSFRYRGACGRDHLSAGAEAPADAPAEPLTPERAGVAVMCHSSIQAWLPFP